MRVSGHMYGGSGVFKRFLIGATVTSGGTLTMDGGAAANTGLIPVTSGSFADTVGLAEEAATYDATPTVAEGGTGLVTVDIRPDAIIQARMSGDASTGSALPIMTNTAASTTVMTSADANDGDFVSGTMWLYPGRGMEAGDNEWRMISADGASASVTVNVAFETSIPVGGRALECPYSIIPMDVSADDDASSAVQTVTLLTEADAEIAAGTGGAVHVVALGLRDELSSYVEFLLSDHVYGHTLT